MHIFFFSLFPLIFSSFPSYHSHTALTVFTPYTLCPLSSFAAIKPSTPTSPRCFSPASSLQPLCLHPPPTSRLPSPAAHAASRVSSRSAQNRTGSPSAVALCPASAPAGVSAPVAGRRNLWKSLSYHQTRRTTQQSYHLPQPHPLPLSLRLRIRL